MNPGDLVSGKYRLLRLIGSGGMGSVWAARNELTDRDFAIKFLLQRLASNNEALNRFFHEARACGQLKHPAIVDVYDMGQAEDGTPYIVMELLEGEGMDRRLAEVQKFDPLEAAAWISFVARGLHEAHLHGIIHRDLKPANIFFALDDRGDVLPKVLDFGISKASGPKSHEHVVTMQGMVLGSPAYMSPEQAGGDLDIDARSDVWALGVILYEAIVGKPPFHASNYNALMVEILTKDHTPVSELVPMCPQVISSIIDEALEKDRDKRIHSAQKLADRLERALLPFSGPQVAFQPRGSMLSFRPPAMANPVGTTQGPWSDAAPTQQLPRRRSRTPLIAIGMGVLAIGIAGALVAFRTAPPVVAVASRANIALVTALARAHNRVELLKAEAIAAEKIKEAEAKAQQEPEPPPPTKASPRAVVKHPGKPAPAPKKDDPHGGVEGPGF